MSGEDHYTCSHILEEKGPHSIELWWQVLYLYKTCYFTTKA